MLYLLFFIDHNISSILTQSPKFNLKKPPAYHWDFFCLGITIVPCGIMGLPPGSGLIPQAPLHTRALATRIVVEKHGIKQEVTTHVEEQRWSALGQAALMFVALSAFVIISWIPKGALFGVFLYLGVGAMHGNDIWKHLMLMFMLEKKRPLIPVVKNVRWRTVQIFTAVEIACAALIFGVAQFASVGTYACSLSLALQLAWEPRLCAMYLPFLLKRKGSDLFFSRMFTWHRLHLSSARDGPCTFPFICHFTIF
jgi:hypothetical protein